MRIVHFSDWHGYHRLLPPADLYVCTGDMYPDVADQAAWARTHQTQLPSQIVCVRGNHDFHPLASLFDAPAVTEITAPSRWGTANLPVWIAVTPGTVLPPAWGWSDSLSEQGMADRLGQLARADFLVTHGPGFSVLDKGGRFRQNLGSTAISDWVAANRPKVHLFGHIHESFGFAHDSNGVLCVNSAVGWHLLEDNDGEWAVVDYGRLTGAYDMFAEE